MKYLYIFEDGRAGVAPTKPTAEDLVAIGDAMLQVFAICEDGTILEVDDEEGDLMDADRCELLSTHDGRQFHTWAN